MEEKKDVELEALHAELEKALKTDSEEEVTPGASPEKPQEKETPSPETKEDEGAELSEEDISKLTPRAQKRIRDQAAKIAELSKPAEKSPELPKKDEEDSQDFKNVDEFLNAVEDEPSRKLLEKFAKVLKAENSAVLAPFEQKNNETKFETEFSQYEKIEGLSDYKNDLRKTFLRNPNQSLKSLIGEVVTDLQLSKVKPVEKTPSSPNRGKVDTSNLSKDELYDMLDTMRA